MNKVIRNAVLSKYYSSGQVLGNTPKNREGVTEEEA